MAGLIKNQILKHLSKFTKNLSADKINLSTLKGEGELSNLELDEAILTELLELPTWLRITKAECNRVGIKIQWTKLKSQPICLYLDKVVLETETCEEPRPPMSPTHQASYRSGGKYGFVDRVIDGIYIHINSAVVKMTSKTFHASLELSRIKVHSVTPTWQSGQKDLRATRIRDPDRGQILLFKEVEWQTTRIEANGVELSCPEDVATTPLRLIANQAKIRITLKKRLSDCGIVSSRVVLLLDDLLWVLTNTQLKAAIVYANSLSDVIQRSAKQAKQNAAEKLQKEGQLDNHTTDQLRQQQQLQQQQRVSSTQAARYFAKYDVVTSSFHVITCRVDLHLCDDTVSSGDKNAKKPWNIEGGAMQITMHRLSFDSYPYNIAGGERKHWYRYADNVGDRNAWVQQLLTQFRETVAHVQKARPMPSPTAKGPRRESPHTRQGSPVVNTRGSPSHQGAVRSPQASPSHQAGSGGRLRFTKMLESCYVVKVEDFVVYMVSTPDNKRTGHHKLLASDKKALHLPPDMSVLHLEFTEYFFPDGLQFPVPHSNLYLLVNPVRLTLDYLTMLWINYFILNLSQDVKLDPNAPEREHVDTKIMIVMSRLIMPSEMKMEQQGERPDAVQIQASRVTVSNCRVEEHMKHADLQSVVDQYRKAPLFQPPLAFPADSAPLCSIPPSLAAHASRGDNPYLDKTIKLVLDTENPEELGKGETLETNSLKQAACSDVWCVILDQVWLEFLGVHGSRSRPVPFVEAFPLSLWISLNAREAGSKSRADFATNGRASNPTCSGEGIVDKRVVEEREKRPQRLILKQYYSLEEDDDSKPNDASANVCDRNENPHDASLCDRGRRKGKAAEKGEGGSVRSETCEVHGGASDQGKESPAAGSEVADTHILLRVGAKVRIQVTHHQYLFLLRLSESFAKFQLQLIEDMRGLGLTSSATVCLPLVVPEVEFAVVCPYQLNQPGFAEDFGSPLCVNIGKEPAEAEIPPSGTKPTVGISDELEICQEPFPEMELQPSKGSTQLPGAGNPHILFSKSLSDSTLQSLTLEGAILTPQEHAAFAEGAVGCLGEKGGMHRTAQSISNLPSSADQDSLLTLNSNGGDSGLGMDSKRSSVKNMKSFKGTDVKKVFSSAFTNFTDKLNKLKPDDDSLSDDMDSMSIQTDLSDDDFEQINWDDGEDIPAFAHDPPSEASTDTYSDGGQDDTSSLYAESSTTKGKEMVSVVLFGLRNTELMVQATEAATLVAAQVSTVSTTQPGNVSYEEFFSKFSTAKGYMSNIDSMASRNGLYPVKLLSVMQNPPEGSEKDACLHSLVTVRAEDLSLQFEMSSLTALTEFVTDEKIAEVVPMDVSLNNITFVLNDDGGSGSGSPTSAPVALQLHKMAVQRGIDGVFHIRAVDDGGSGTSPSSSVDTADSATSPTLVGSPEGQLLSMESLLAENAKLQKQVLELVKARRWFGEQLSQHKSQLKVMESLRQENTQLQSKVKRLQQWQSEVQEQLESGERGQAGSRERGQAKSQAGEQGPRSGSLEAEDASQCAAQLHQRVVELEEELSHANQEKESLLATLRLVQEELLISERKNRERMMQSNHS